MTLLDGGHAAIKGMTLFEGGSLRACTSRSFIASGDGPAIRDAINLPAAMADRGGCVACVHFDICCPDAMTTSWYQCD
jgi:hypothetical protein